MRILVVSQYFWPESFRINDLVTELASRGHEVAVLTGNPNYPAGEFSPGYGGWRTRRERWQNVVVMRVPHLARGTGGGVRLAANFASFALSASLLGPWLFRRFWPEVVLVHEPSPLSVAIPGLILGRLKKAPTALWVQDLWPETLSAVGPVNSGRLFRLLRAVCSRIHRSFDAILVQSSAFIDPLVEQGVDARRISYLPNWAEDLYRPVQVAPADERRSELPPGFRIVFAGNVGHSQSFETVLGAAEQLLELRDLHWVIIGDGRRAGWLAQEVERRGLSGRFHLLGRRPIEEMPTYNALASALLVSLRAEPIYEMTIPSKIQTCLASGKPLVASLDGEGARVIVESGAGVVAPAEDVGRLAAVVRQLYALDQLELEEMGRRARAYYETNFDRSFVIDTGEQQLTALAQRVAT